MGGYQPGNEGLLGWLAEMCEVVVAEVLAVGWQLVVLERGQNLLQLQEEALAGCVAVGEHVEPTPVPFSHLKVLSLRVWRCNRVWHAIRLGGEA